MTDAAKPGPLAAFGDLVKLALAGQAADVLAVLHAHGLQAPADRMIVRTAREVAEFFGASEAAVRKWVERGMPKQPDAGGYRYSLTEIARWYFARNKAAGIGGGDEEAEEAHRRKAVADATFSEIRTEKAADALMPVADHEGRMWELARTIRDQVRALPERIADRMPDVPDVRAQAAAAVFDLCRDLAALEHPTQPAPPPAQTFPP